MYDYNFGKRDFTTQLNDIAQAVLIAQNIPFPLSSFLTYLQHMVAQLRMLI